MVRGALPQLLALTFAVVAEASEPVPGWRIEDWCLLSSPMPSAELLQSPPALLQAGYDAACAQVEQMGDHCAEPALAEAAWRWSYGVARADLLVNLHAFELAPGAFAVFHEEASDLVQVPLDVGVSLDGHLELRATGDEATLAFPVDTAAANDIRMASEMQRLGLRMVVEPAALRAPRTELCLPSDHGTTVIMVTPVWAELVDVGTDAVLAAVRTDAWADARVRIGEEPTAATGHLQARRALVQTLYSECERNPLTIGGTWLRLALESALGLCYAEARVTNAASQGAVTLGFGLDATGLVHDPAWLIDMVDSEALRTCAHELLPQLHVPSAWIDGSMQVRANVTFE